MLKLGRVSKFKMLFLVLVLVFNFDLFKFSAAILEKGLFKRPDLERAEKQVSFQVASQHCFTVVTSMIN